MPKYVVIDTETSGLTQNHLPADHPDQPYLASLALIFVNESIAVEREEQFLVKPDGWVMSAEAEAVNGLSTAHLLANGRPVSEALDAYVAAIEAGYVVVAHNAQFDCKIMRGALRRAGRDDMFERTPNICTMRGLMGVCRIPNKNGKGIKMPKLAEAMAHFKLEQPPAHTAMGDARSVYALLRMMVRIGVMPEPAIHHAKEGTKAGDALKARGGTPEPGNPLGAPQEPETKEAPKPASKLADEELPL